ncbi:MAG: M14/M99 family metallopeptidase, partial [Desulfobacteraceae bacterium]
MRRDVLARVMQCLFLTLPFCFAAGAFSEAREPGTREHIVYFRNTAYELNIYRIYGKRPGKTLMLIGGIQGNEPGGFLSADLYADMRLEKGNLIVVPRANFYSIILNKRGVNGDMNRKFAGEDEPDTMEDRIVSILKELIRESDYLLNLHDGAGYYHPTYIDKWRNPTRFGQSIIADCETYQIPGTDKEIRLGEMARKVIAAVNPRIQNELHKFHFMNTRTGQTDSPHREQRMSATYYALTKHHIPAFGVETSKFLPSLDLKVRYHNLIINEFKKMFGIIPESPGMNLEEPILKYLVVSINGRTPIVVRDREPLRLSPGDTINVTHIEANYERGLSMDILGHGDLNDFRKDFKIVRETSIIVRKDNHTFAEIPVVFSEKKEPAPEPVEERSFAAARKEEPPDELTYFMVETGGRRLVLENGERLELVRGDVMKLVDILPSFGPEEVTVNFKGFVGDWENNTGEDRGYEIDTEEALLDRYALN